MSKGLAAVDDVQSVIIAELVWIERSGIRKAVARDLFFRRFVKLSLSEPVPDHSSLWRFRQLLSELGLLEAFLEEVNDQKQRNRINS